jgi:acetoin utilization protein AcuB
LITALQLLVKDVPVLRTEDDPQKALNLMDQAHLVHLPVVDGDKFVGLVSEDELLDQEGEGSTLAPQLVKVSVLPNIHVLDILKVAGERHLSVIPVVDHEDRYMGAITLNYLVEKLNEMQGGTQKGGIIVLEMWSQDYTLQQIARIVEENDGKILSTSVAPGEDGKIELHLKVNLSDLNPIIQSLERFNYHIKASYQERIYDEDLQRRYDELMRYLNI